MRIFCVILLLLVNAVGCKSYDPQRVEEDFGESVRQMIKEQTHAAAAVPAVNGPDWLDGPTAVETVENYEATTKRNRESGKTSLPGVTQ